MIKSKKIISFVASLIMLCNMISYAAPASSKSEIVYSQSFGDEMTADKVLISYKLKINEVPQKDEAVPVLMCNDKIISRADITGEMMTLDGQYPLEEYMERKSDDYNIPMKMEKEREYLIGYVLDFDKHTMDYYMLSNSEYLRLENIKFFDETVEQLTDVSFNRKTGNYEITDFETKKYDETAFMHFQRKFDVVDTNVDHMEDVKSQMLDDELIFCIDSPFVISKDIRKMIEQDRQVVKPELINGSVYVPLRYIAEEYGYDVNYDEKTSLVKVEKGEVCKTVGSEDSVVKNGRTLLKISKMAELLDKKAVRLNDEIVVFTNDEQVSERLAELMPRILNSFRLYVKAEDDKVNIADCTGVEKAVQKIRAMRKQNGIPEGGFIVYLRGGYYMFENPLSFTEEDSGSADAPIIYSAYNDEEVIFTSGTHIPASAFEPVIDPQVRIRFYNNVVNKVKQVDLKKLGVKSFVTVKGSYNGDGPADPDAAPQGIFTVNDKQKTLARWPDGTYAKTGHSIVLKKWAGAELSANTAPIERWANAKDPAISGFLKWNWKADTARVKIDAENKKFITLDATYDGIEANKNYYVFNLMEEITVPGEWYVDRDTLTLYYYPDQYLDMNSAKFLLVGTNDCNIVNMDKVCHITFSGVDFCGSVKDAVKVNDSFDVKILGADFKNSRRGIVSQGSTEYLSVRGCNFYYLLNGAVRLHGGGNTETLRKSNNILENCYFTMYSINVASDGVSFDGEGQQIVNCEFNGNDRSALGGRGRFIRIENNEICNNCILSDDNGSIYTALLWETRQMMFKNNVFHDNPGYGVSTTHDIYIDDGQHSSIIIDNLFYNSTKQAPVKGVGYQTWVRNNLFVDVPNQAIIALTNDPTVHHPLLEDNKTVNSENFFKLQDALDSIWKQPWQNSFWQIEFPALYERMNMENKWRVTKSLEDNYYAARYMTVKDNLYVNLGGEIFSTHEKNKENNFYEKELHNKVENNVVTDDTSIFKDYENDDFTLTKELPIENFTGPDIKKAGIYLSDDRDSLMPITDFELVYPINGQRNVDANSVSFLWEAALGVRDYILTVATDAQFKNVVLEKTVTWVTGYQIVEPLDFANTTYYWKVEAKGNSLNKKNKKQCERVYSFTTADKEVVDTKEFKSTIDNLKVIVDTAYTDGTAGSVTEEQLAELEKAYSEGKALLDAGFSTKSQHDKAVTKYAAIIREYDRWRKVGHVDLVSVLKPGNAQWQASNMHWIVWDEDTMKFESAVKDCSQTDVVFGYDEVLPTYPIWTFKAVMDLNNEVNEYHAFYLRASSPRQISWAGGANYIFIFKENVIELHKFGSGSFSMEAPNPFTSDKKEHLFELAALDVEDGVRLLLKVDGDTVYDYVDTENPIKEPGYFSVIAPAGSPMIIEPAGDDMPKD